MQRFTELQVWKRAHQLTLSVYKLTSQFPRHEQYALTSQVRRSASSVAANIAEGSKRRTRIEYARFLNIAEGSLAETEYFLILCADLGYIAPELAGTTRKEIDEIARMLNSLRSKVEHTE
jgi:four helix bundle protein